MMQYGGNGFTVPVHPTGALAERNGFYQDEVNGERRYVTVDDLGRAALGPRVHRSGGLWPNLTRKHTKQTQENMKTEDNSADTTVIVLDGEEVEEVQEAVIVPEWQERLRLTRKRWAERVQDKQWHETSRQCAVTLFTWVSLGAVGSACVKAAYWVVTL